jgi:LDH2 family malate/lactate/ureidoglycolate dehydrogenase
MKISEKHLKQVISNLLTNLGAESNESDLVAEVLISADKRGIHTHGTALLPLIMERKDAGILNIPTRITKIIDEDACTLIDGNNGLGPVAAKQAIEISITKAKQYGIAVTLVRNTNNIGSLGYYTMMAASAGMVGICMTNSAPAMAPWGGSEPFFGTNPLSIAAPIAGRPPVVLDMSSSVVARGKIRRAQRLKQAIPDNWALDESGNPTADPAEALKGTLIPIAGPKGYGLALFIDLLCGLLSGSKYGRDILTFHKPLGPTGVGATFIAFDIARFMPLERFEAAALDYSEEIRNSKKAVGTTRIYIPGEIEAGNEETSRAQGVHVDSETVEKINQYLKQKGLQIDLKEDCNG